MHGHAEIAVGRSASNPRFTPASNGGLGPAVCGFQCRMARGWSGWTFPLLPPRCRPLRFFSCTQIPQFQILVCIWIPRLNAIRGAASSSP
jgi:hypothetical protein